MKTSSMVTGIIFHLLRIVVMTLLLLLLLLLRTVTFYPLLVLSMAKAALLRRILRVVESRGRADHGR